MQKIKDFLFTNQSIRQTIIKNTFWLTIANVAGRAIRALLVIYAARVLGVAGFGVFSYALSFAALFIGFGDIGISSILNRELAKKLDTEKKIIATSFFIKIILGIVVYAALCIAAWTVVPIASAKIIIPIISLALLLDSFREFGFSITRAFEKMEIEAGITVFYQIVSVILGFFVLFFWTTPLSLALIYVTGSLAGVVLIAFYLKKYFRDLKKDFDWSLIKPIIRDAWPFAIISFGNLILLYTDTIFLGWLKADVDVGYYNAASKILQVVNFIPTLFILSLFPTITQRIVKHQGRPIIEKAIAFMLLIGLPIAIGGFLIPNFIIQTVFGNSYANAIPIFQVLILMTVFSFANVPVYYALFAHNKQIKTVKYFLGSAFLNTFLNYFFIKEFGNVGAALATFISQFIGTLGSFYELFKIEKIKIFPHIWRIMVATGAMAVAIILSKGFLNQWIIFAIAPFVYLAVLKILKEPLLNELLKNPF